MGTIWANVRAASRSPLPFSVVAGWDLDFDVDTNDEALARGCFRILRRTCARYYLEFRYYEERRTDERVHFVLVFSGRPPQLGLAAADFALEMRAVASLQRHTRARRLPMRLLQWVTYSGSEEPLRIQPTSDRVPDEKREQVVRHLTEYSLAWGSWRRGDVTPPDYVEAQHSLLTNLALDLAEGADKTMHYPELIRRLKISQRWEQDCLDLGTSRNRVKHRGYRHEAARYAEIYEQCVYSVAYEITGIDAMPRTAYMLRWEEAGEKVLPPPMFDRWGRPKIFTRY